MKTPINKYRYIQEWKAKNPEKMRLYRKRWLKKHKNYQKEYRQRRKVLNSQSISSGLDK